MTPGTASDSGEVVGRGWYAIEQALTGLYGNAEAHQFSSMVPFQLGGPDPIEEIHAYAVEEPRPHWHLVTYGFSELYEKENDDPDVSGYGFELTFRITRDPSEDEPPTWARDLLQNLGRYVFQTGNAFGAGHHMNLNGPLAQGTETRLRAFGLHTDARLPAHISTPNGKVQFLQLVGLTLEELSSAQAWNTEKLIALLGESIPFLITDLERGSPLDLPEVQRQVDAGIEKDGSSMGSTYVTSLGWSESGSDVRIELGALAVPGLKRAMKGRLLHDRPFFYLNGETRTAVGFLPSGDEEPGWGKDEDGDLIVRLDQEQALAICDKVEAKQGVYSWPGLPSVAIEISVSELTDADGNVVEVIGG
jgi:suppressor of fused-like protein